MYTVYSFYVQYTYTWTCRIYYIYNLFFVCRILIYNVILILNTQYTSYTLYTVYILKSYKTKKNSYVICFLRIFTKKKLYKSDKNVIVRFIPLFLKITVSFLFLFFIYTEEKI